MENKTKIAREFQNLANRIETENISNLTGAGKTPDAAGVLLVRKEARNQASAEIKRKYELSESEILAVIEIEENQLLSQETIIGGIFVTLLWSVGIGVGVFHLTAESWLSACCSAAASLFLFPIVGRICSALTHWICNGFDAVYSLEGQSRWGSWDITTKFWVAAFWPICTPVVLVVNGIGIVYGLLFRGLFGQSG